MLYITYYNVILFTLRYLKFFIKNLINTKHKTYRHNNHFSTKFLYGVLAYSDLQISLDVISDKERR